MYSKRELCKKMVEKTLVSFSGNIQFVMGNDDDEYIGESPTRIVRLNNFSISQIPITREMYSLYDPSIQVDETNKNYPMTDVNWYEAMGFCKWIGMDLPTEAEWEYACKEDDSLFKGELENYCWYSQNSKSILHEVAQLKASKSGLFDMFGNIWEWNKDFYSTDYYSEGVVDNPVNKKDSGYKVCRGGSYYSFDEMCRSSFRWKEPTNYKAKDLGFRVVSREMKGEYND